MRGWQRVMLARSFVAIFMVTTSHSLATTTRDAWELVGTSGGVTVFRRQESDRDIVSVKGTGTIAAPMQKVFEALIDNQHAHEWMPMVVLRRDIQTINVDARLEYTHVEMPWPLTDRYLVAESHVERLEDGSLLLLTQSVSQPALREKDKVLAELHISRIQLRAIPQEPQKTEITVELNSDPKGTIPRWLVNMFQKNWPREFIGNLQHYVATHDKKAAH